MKNRLLIVGSIAYDNIQTPVDSVEWALGGSASYAALAASFFAPASVCGIVGRDFKESDMARLARRGTDVSDVEVDRDGERFLERQIPRQFQQPRDPRNARERL